MYLLIIWQWHMRLPGYLCQALGVVGTSPQVKPLLNAGVSWLDIISRAISIMSEVKIVTCASALLSHFILANCSASTWGFLCEGSFCD